MTINYYFKLFLLYFTSITTLAAKGLFEDNDCELSKTPFDVVPHAFGQAMGTSTLLQITPYAAAHATKQQWSVIKSTLQQTTLGAIKPTLQYVAIGAVGYSLYRTLPASFPWITTAVFGKTILSLAKENKELRKIQPVKEAEKAIPVAKSVTADIESVEPVVIVSKRMKYDNDEADQQRSMKKGWQRWATIQEKRASKAEYAFSKQMQKNYFLKTALIRQEMKSNAHYRKLQQVRQQLEQKDKDNAALLEKIKKQEELISKLQDKNHTTSFLTDSLWRNWTMSGVTKGGAEKGKVQQV